MDTYLFQVISTLIFFIIIFVSGYSLNRTGKPYKTVTFNTHKVISLVVIAFLVIIIYNINQLSELSSLEWMVSVITGILFLTGIISGGFISIDKSLSETVSTIHKVTSFLTVFTTAVLLYLLLTHI